MLWCAALLAPTLPVGVATAAPGDPAALTIRVEGADVMFGFSSPTPALNFNLPSFDGVAQSLPVWLAANDYRITADDLSGLGIVVKTITCDDGRGQGDVASGSLAVTLEPGDMVTCIFRVAQAAQRSEQIIGTTLSAQSQILLASLPPSEDRIDRLRGSISVVDSPKPFMNALPGIVAGKPIPIAASLAAYNKVVGNEQRDLWDFWLQGTFALFADKGPDGRSTLVTMGADYLVRDNLLAGGFVQADRMSRQWDDGSAVTRQGWMAGGYATAQVGDNVFLDVLAGGGSALGMATGLGLSQGQFGAATWLVTAALLGDWSHDGWTFSPQARLSYVDQAVTPYLDSLGNLVEGQHLGSGQLSIGPGLAYKLTTQNNVAVQTGLRLDTRAALLHNGEMTGLQNVNGRVEGTLEIALPTGPRWKTTLGYAGIGSDNRLFNAKGSLSVPLR